MGITAQYTPLITITALSRNGLGLCIICVMAAKTFCMDCFSLFFSFNSSSCFVRCFPGDWLPLRDYCYFGWLNGLYEANKWIHEPTIRAHEAQNPQGYKITDKTGDNNYNKNLLDYSN